LHGAELLAHRIAASLAVGAALLALALVSALAVRPRTAAAVTPAEQDSHAIAPTSAQGRP
jgi:hypothetical protein